MSGEEPRIEWEYKERFPIHDKMEEVIDLAIKASEAELDGLRRKLDKLQYGS